MLARDLRLLLAIELVLWFAWAMAKAVLGTVSFGGALVLFAGGPLMLRGGLAAATFAFAWNHRTPRAPQHRLKPGAAAALFLREWRAWVTLFMAVMPLERFFLPPDRTGEGGGEPVLLVHGYCCNRGMWWWIAPRLEARGYRVATVNLEPALGDIDGHADQLAARIEALCAETGASAVTLVGMSMGGLVARAYLRRHGAGRVSRLVTLGTPHHGSWLARLGLGRNARQMEPGSEWLRELDAAGIPAGMPFTAVLSRHDNFVMPQAGADHPDARSVLLDGVGHLDMTRSPAVFDALCRALEAPPQK